MSSRESEAGRMEVVLQSLETHHIPSLKASAMTTAAMPNQPKDRQRKRVRPPDLTLDPKKTYFHRYLTPVGLGTNCNRLPIQPF